MNISHDTYNNTNTNTDTDTYYNIDSYYTDTNTDTTNTNTDTDTNTTNTDNNTDTYTYIPYIFTFCLVRPPLRRKGVSCTLTLGLLFFNAALMGGLKKGLQTKRAELSLAQICPSLLRITLN